MAHIPFDEDYIEEEIQCSKITYDPSRGVKVCEDTGEVIEEGVIGDESDVKAFTPEEKMQKAHHGGPLQFSRQHMGIEAHIVAPKESGPKGLKPVRRETLKRFPRGGRASSSTDKNLQQALSIINDVAAKLELPDIVREEASKIYRDAMQKGLTRGRSVESVVAAVIYAATRIHDLHHGLNDIIKAIKGNVDPNIRREVARSYRLLVRDLGIRIPVRRPENFVWRITHQLQLPEKVALDAIKIINDARKKGLTAGKDPSGLAGAAVYLAALKHGYRKTQKEIAQVAGVTEVTIRNRYKEITRFLGIEEEALEASQRQQGSS